jgi:NADPH:quinone reductase-like Zn-dependent oxidoreductase
MHAIHITRFGGPGVLKTMESRPLALSPDGVRVRVRAAGINFADIMMRMGLYPEAPRPPFVPGYEIAGVVEETGRAAAEAFSPGDRVLAACRFGGYATQAVIPASQARKIPAGLSDAEAAALPVNFMTAWIALMEMARIRSGDRVLLPGAAGGVGTAAVQIAAHEGARVVALVGSSGKKNAVAALGAGEVFTYGEWDSRKDSAGFNAIMDSRGGSELKASIKLLSPGGRMVSYGVSGMVRGPTRSIFGAVSTLLGTPVLTPIGLAMSNKGVFGLNMLTLFDSRDGMALLMSAMDRVLEGFAAGRFRVIIGRTFPMKEAGGAQEYLRSRANVGKVVLIAPGN